MAAYPSYGILLSSQQERESSWQDDVADSGQLSSRQMRSLNYYQFTLSHHMTVIQYRALATTYAAGPRDTYTLTYLTESPQVTYSVQFVAPPQIINNRGGDKFVVQVVLRGTPD